MKFFGDTLVIGRKAIIADLHLGLIRFYDRRLIEKAVKVAEHAQTVIVAGDLRHLGKPSSFEDFIREVGGIAELILLRGNHDAGIEARKGLRIGKYGIFHGHAVPNDDVMAAKHLIFAHAHPSIFIADDVGGHKERVFLVGEADVGGEIKRITVLPAFNDLCASTAVNLERPSGFMFRRCDYTRWRAVLLDGTVLSLDSL